jgi:hypothetical protein
MKDKIYKEFKAITYQPSHQTDKEYLVVTDDEDELVIAKIPTHLRNTKAIATALAEALTKSKLALTDLI